MVTDGYSFWILFPGFVDDGWNANKTLIFRNSRIESTLLTPAKNIKNSNVDDDHDESIVASLIWKTETWKSNRIEWYYLDGDQVERQEKAERLCTDTLKSNRNRKGCPIKFDFKNDFRPKKALANIPEVNNNL